MKRPSAPAIVVILVLAVLVPALYILSIGPAFAMTEQEILDFELYQAIYFPVITTALLCGADDYLFRYLDWWAGTNLQEERFGPIF